MKQGRTRLAMAMALGLLAAAAPALASGPVAQAARTLNVDDRARLTLVRRDGNRIYERGTATGTLPGRVSAYFDVGITKVTGRMTIYPRSGGSLTVSVSGTPQSSGVRARFTGVLAVRGGTGRFANALGSGTFAGTVNRDTWAASASANVQITY